MVQLNWDQDKESASIEEAHASCVEVSTPVTYIRSMGSFLN